MTGATSGDEPNEDGEKRVRWMATLAPATPDDLAGNGIDETWDRGLVDLDELLEPPRPRPLQMPSPDAPPPDRCPPHHRGGLSVQRDHAP